MHSPTGMHASLTRPFRWFEGTLAPRLALSASFRVSKEIVGKIICLFRRENYFQADLLPFNVNKHSPEALCSIGITRLHHYYCPIRLPKRLSPVIHSRVRLDEVVCYHRPVRRLGSPKFLISLSTPAVPFYPGSLIACMCLLLRRQNLSSPPVEGWTRSAR